MIYQLVYASTARKVMSEEALFELLNKARENNEKLQITGFLVYHSAVFLQYLEGPETAVKTLFDKICQDPRHSACTILLESSSDQRIAEQWSMAYKKIDEIKPELMQKLVEITEAYQDKQDMSDRDKIMDLLRRFRLQL